MRADATIVGLVDGAAQALRNLVDGFSGAISDHRRQRKALLLGGPHRMFHDDWCKARPALCDAFVTDKRRQPRGFFADRVRIVALARCT
jgi:hypothetical protein